MSCKHCGENIGLFEGGLFHDSHYECRIFNRYNKCKHMHKDDPDNAKCEDCNSCECGNEIKQYEEGDDTMEMCEDCK